MVKVNRGQPGQSSQPVTQAESKKGVEKASRPNMRASAEHVKELQSSLPFGAGHLHSFGSNPNNSQAVKLTQNVFDRTIGA